jgi:hypothetical protein
MDLAAVSAFAGTLLPILPSTVEVKASTLLVLLGFAVMWLWRKPRS